MNLLDLQLVIAARELPRLKSLNIDALNLLCSLITQLPITTFELYQGLIENYLNSSINASLIGCLRNLLERSSGDDKNNIRKLFVRSNIPQIILNLLSAGTADDVLQKAEGLTDIIYIISQGTREVTAYLATEIHLRGNLTESFLIFD